MTSNAELIKLASLISEASEDDIPSHLLQLKRILQEYPELSKGRQDLKREIMKYDLLSYCSMALRYDFSVVKGGFSTAVGIIEILFECCVDINLDDSGEPSDTVLPDSVQNSLFIAWKIQQKYLDKVKQYGVIKFGVHAEEMAVLKTQYQAIMDSILKILTSHPFLVKSLLESDNLIRILIEEDDEGVKMIISTLEIILRGIRVSPHTIRALSTSALNHLLDELIFNITTSESDDLAALTVKIIIAMVDASPEIANKMSVRFKGLKTLLSRWLGHGFDRALRNLIAILDAGNAKIAELARRAQAVKTIWAAYQGWKTRSRVGNLKKVIPSLQSSFRRKRQEKLEYALKERLHDEQRFASEMTRKKSMRSAHEKQLQMLEIVPARTVNRYIQQQESSAAVKIQSIWRGAMQRRKFQSDKFIQKASSAAVVIQRAVRRFLAKRQQMRKPVQRPIAVYSKLTEERRKELKMEIDQRRVVRAAKEITFSEADKIHDETQKNLLLYHKKRTERFQIQDPRLQALVAKLHTEEEMLDNLPSLDGATYEQIDAWAFASTAVALAAECEHKRMVKEFTSSWWQKLPLKDGENLDPFEEKIKHYDVDERELEEMLNM